MEPDWRIEALKTFVPIVAAFIVGGFAIRNARKTPHERLKNLVDIAKDMPEGLDVDQSVQRAITAELVDFERLMSASRKGFWAKRKEHVIQHRFRYTVAIAVCVGAAVAVGAGYIARRLQLDAGQLAGFSPTAATVLTFAASLIAFALSTSKAASDRRSALRRADELWVIKHNRRLPSKRDTETEPDPTPESGTD